jgi:hypothetical protein
MSKMLKKIEHEHLNSVDFTRKFTEGAQDVQDAHRILSVTVSHRSLAICVELINPVSAVRDDVV